MLAQKDCRVVAWRSAASICVFGTFYEHIPIGWELCLIVLTGKATESVAASRLLTKATVARDRKASMKP